MARTKKTTSTQKRKSGWYIGTEIAAVRSEIEKRLVYREPLLVIWRDLTEKGLVSSSYEGFRRAWKRESENGLSRFDRDPEFSQGGETRRRKSDVDTDEAIAELRATLND